jgi:3-hydroxymyristoyl/3-hydroxydecanoyl-(acyl carrier protein) dehydratase
MSPDFVVRRVAVDAASAHFHASVPHDLVFFEGHFEGNPILPGIAELLVLVQRRAREVWGPLGREKRLVRMKFERAIRPGDELDVHLTREVGEPETQLRFRIERGGATCASGAIVYATGD